jgi:3-methyladenine DNA glycosylase AlkD
VSVREDFKPSTAADARRRLRELANRKDAVFLQRFFKTGAGQYGAGDKFLGIRVPVLRRVARELRGMPVNEIEAVLQDEWHEARLLALFLLVDAFNRGSSADRDAIAKLYLRNTRWINNWDLVDSSAAPIIGAHLASRSRKVLDTLAHSSLIWERRIAIVATHHFIRNGEFGDTLRIATQLLDDEQDLIHKATGWMLREVGNRDRGALERFLEAHAATMPRTTLRYAIEKLPPADRRRFMMPRP